MGQMRQFRDPGLSLWQSAVDEVVAKRKGGAQSEGVGASRVISQRPPGENTSCRKTPYPLKTCRPSWKRKTLLLPPAARIASTWCVPGTKAASRSKVASDGSSCATTLPRMS